MVYISGGSLTNVVEAMELDEYCIATITREALKALHYLHSKRIIHRDIKVIKLCFRLIQWTITLQNISFSENIICFCSYSR